VSKRLQLPVNTVHKVLQIVLKIYPYKLCQIQAISDVDKLYHMDFTLMCAAQIGEDENLLWRLFFTDKAHFYLLGFMNSKNCIILSEDNPHGSLPVPLHDKKVTIW
jgi:hypothetical protein